MKTLTKISLIVIMMTATIAQSYSQGLYINVGAGYNFSAAKELLGTDQIPSATEGVYGSFGKGLSAGAGVGFMFGDHVGAELGFSYLLGSKYEFKDTEGSSTSVTEAKGKMLRIIPAIRVTAGESVMPYAKLGVVIGVSPKLDFEETGVDAFGGGSAAYTASQKYSGGSSLGFMGAVGIDFDIADMLAIYVELNNITQSWAPTEVESTYASAGVSETRTIALEEINPDHTSITSPDLIDLKQYFPFSSLGFNMGIKFFFGNK